TRFSRDWSSDVCSSDLKYPGIVFKQLREVGNQILNVEKLGKTADGKLLFNDVSFTVNKGDKIAIVADDQTAVTAFFEVINGESKIGRASCRERVESSGT